jgi:hypothetical protein
MQFKTISRIFILKEGVHQAVVKSVFVLILILIVPFTIPVKAGTGSTAASSPYPPSPVISGISFDWSTHVRMANGSDNWPVTWAADDHQYTTWGDGGGFGGSNQDGRVSLGVARIEGSSSSYRGVNVWGGKDALQPAQFTGKSYGIAAVDGSLYMWRCGDGSLEAAFIYQRLYRSTNQGQSWQETGVEYTQSSFSGSRGFYCPTFLQYGKDYQGARDGYVYMYAPELKSSSWEVQKPGEITLMRVPRSGLSSRSQYEYFAGLDGGGSPVWTGDMNGRRPVFQDRENGVMTVSVSYNPGLGRYFLITEHTTGMRGNIGIYDAPEPWGPWTTVLFESGFGTPGIDATTFFWNFANKWLSADGRDFTMVFTGVSSNDSWNTVRGRFNPGGSSTNPDPIPVPTSLRLRINFQTSTTGTPSGYLADDGAAYGARGNNHTYGWNADNYANARERNAPNSPDKLRDTFNHLIKDGRNYTWDIEVPNGEYRVRIIAGDPNNTDSNYKIDVEGQRVVDGSPSSSSLWVAGSAVVSVRDGKLTVSNGDGAENNKINFIEISNASSGFLFLPSLNNR